MDYKYIKDLVDYCTIGFVGFFIIKIYVWKLLYFQLYADVFNSL